MVNPLSGPWPDDKLNMVLACRDDFFEKMVDICSLIKFVFNIFDLTKCLFTFLSNKGINS